jgi:hypothetical protein
MSGQPWNKTDDDLDRAFRVSASIVRRYNIPDVVIQHCRIDPPKSASDMFYDGSVVGVEFSEYAGGCNTLILRIVGPIWDRWMALRFSGVSHFESERSNLFNIGEIYWLEFFDPNEPSSDVTRTVDDFPEGSLGCHIYTLSYRVRHTVVFQHIELESRPIARQKSICDFAVRDDGSWAIRE